MPHAAAERVFSLLFDISILHADAATLFMILRRRAMPCLLPVSVAGHMLITPPLRCRHDYAAT